MKRARLITVLFMLAITISSAEQVFAQEQPKQERPRTSRPAQSARARDYGKA